MKQTFRQLREEWIKDVRSSYRPGQSTSVYKNPSSRELFQLQKDNVESVSIVISGRDVYAFNDVLHHTVVKSISQIHENDFISITCQNMDGTAINDVYLTSTMIELGSKWAQNPGVFDEIKNNPWMKRYMKSHTTIYNLTDTQYEI